MFISVFIYHHLFEEQYLFISVTFEKNRCFIKFCSANRKCLNVMMKCLNAWVAYTPINKTETENTQHAYNLG
jgi:hypothetical protein